MSLSNASTNVLAKRLSISEQQSTWMSTETSKERLINFLTRSATLNKQGEMVVYLPMPKNLIAPIDNIKKKRCHYTII